MPTLDELLPRLASPAASVRRIAILDLLRLSATQPRAMQALITHLPTETDEKSALIIIRHLAATAHHAARPALWRLYEHPATPVRIAHAAIVAHDQLAGASDRSPLQSARGHDTDNDPGSE